MASSDQQASLNSLLQWSIANSTTDTDSTSTTTTTTNGATQPSSESQRQDPARGLNSKMLAELLGGPSDADLMRESMTAILAPAEQVPIGDKLVAWDNFEQLIEQIDNANNMESMGLWPPLLSQLDYAGPEADAPEMRRMAAWCVGTAVQNNVASQEKLMAHGGIPRLARRAVEDAAAGVRKKAISALSSAVRNFQPGLDELEASLPESVWRRRKPGLDAAEMESVDEIIQALRDHSAAASG